MFKPTRPAIEGVDYRELLIKYINQVGEMEGVSFIYDDIKGMSSSEIKALRECETEAGNYWEYIRNV